MDILNDVSNSRELHCQVNRVRHNVNFLDYLFLFFKKHLNIKKQIF